MERRRAVAAVCGGYHGPAPCLGLILELRLEAREAAATVVPEPLISVPSVLISVPSVLISVPSVPRVSAAAFSEAGTFNDFIVFYSKFYQIETPW